MSYLQTVDGYRDFLRTKRTSIGLGPATLSFGEPPKKKGKFAITNDQKVLCRAVDCQEDIKCKTMICDVMQAKEVKIGQVVADAADIKSIVSDDIKSVLVTAQTVSAVSMDADHIDLKSYVSVESKGSIGSPAVRIGDSVGLYQSGSGALSSISPIDIGTHSLSAGDISAGSIDSAGTLSAGDISVGSVVSSGNISADVAVYAPLVVGSTAVLGTVIGAGKPDSSIPIDGITTHVHGVSPIIPLPSRYSAGFTFSVIQAIELFEVGLLGDPGTTDPANLSDYRNYSLWGEDGKLIFTTPLNINQFLNPAVFGFWRSPCPLTTLFPGILYTVGIEFLKNLGGGDFIYPDAQVPSADVVNVTPVYYAGSGIVRPQDPPPQGNVPNNSLGLNFGYYRYTTFAYIAENIADFKVPVLAEFDLTVQGISFLAEVQAENVFALDISGRTLALGEQDIFRASLTTPVSIPSSAVYTLLSPDSFPLNVGSKWDLSAPPQFFWTGIIAKFYIGYRVFWEYKALTEASNREANITIDGVPLAVSGSNATSQSVTLGGFWQSGFDVVELGPGAEYTLQVRQNSGVAADIVEASWFAIRLY